MVIRPASELSVQLPLTVLPYLCRVALATLGGSWISTELTRGGSESVGVGYIRPGVSLVALLVRLATLLEGPQVPRFLLFHASAISIHATLITATIADAPLDTSSAFPESGLLLVSICTPHTR